MQRWRMSKRVTKEQRVEREGREAYVAGSPGAQRTSLCLLLTSLTSDFSPPTPPSAPAQSPHAVPHMCQSPSDPRAFAPAASLLGKLL